MQSAEIVVFGGAGFIGRSVVRALLERGYHVRVASRQAHTRKREARLSYVSADLSDPSSLRAAVGEASIIYHLATGGGETWLDFERSVVGGTQELAGLAHRSGVRRFIYTSSIAALYLGKRGKIDERIGPDQKPKRRALYSRSKIAAEAVLNKMHAESGLPAVIFRPGLVVGPESILTHGGLGYWPSDICCIGWGRGKTPLPFVLVQDVAEALVAAIDAPGVEGRTFNLVGDVRMPACEFIETLGARSCRRFKFYPQSLLKLQALEVVKWMAKIAARKQENPFPSYRDLKSRSLQTDFDCSAAKQALNWRPIASREEFFRQAIDANLPCMHPLDLRVAATLARS